MGPFHGIPFDSPQALDAAMTTLQHLLWTRYVAAAGFTMLLYDHMLTFSDEVKYIWKPGEWTAPKYMFFVVRYGVPFAVLGHIIQMSGLSDITLSDSFCRGYFAGSTAFGLLTIAMTNFIVLLRLWVLWDRDRMAVAVTVFAFVVTNAVALGMLIYMITRVYQTVTWNHAMMMCAPDSRLPIGGLWIPGLVFELIIFVMALFNALYRPRPSHDALARVLYRDGLTYFLVLFGMRIFNVVVGFIAPLSLIFVGVFFVWCSTTITTTRLVINLRKMANAPEYNDEDDFTDPSSTPLPPYTRSPSRDNRSVGGDESSTYKVRIEYSRSTSPAPGHQHVPSYSSFTSTTFGRVPSRTTAVEHLVLAPIRSNTDPKGSSTWVEPDSWRQSESVHDHQSTRASGEGDVIDISRFTLK